MELNDLLSKEDMKKISNNHINEGEMFNSFDLAVRYFYIYQDIIKTANDKHREKIIQLEKRFREVWCDQENYPDMEDIVKAVFK